MEEDVAATVTRNMAVAAYRLPEPAEEDGRIAYRGVTLKVCGLIASKEQVATMRFTKMELWLLKRIDPATAMGKEPVGEKWMDIVSGGLTHLEGGAAAIRDAVAQVGEREGDDGDGPEVRSRMVDWRAQAKGHEHPDG